MECGGSSSDEGLFLTQSKFTEVVSTGDASDLYLDILEGKSSPVPAYEDISNDEELCSALNFGELQFSIPDTKLTESKAGPSRIREILHDDEAAKLNVRSVADNTKKKIEWAVRLFNTWKTERNNMAKYENSISCIHPSLDYMTKDELNFCLSRFIFEVKKINGEDYPVVTLYDLIIQIQLFLEQCGKYYKLLSELSFVQIKNTLDYVMKERSASGIGRNKRKADIVTVEEESIMWEKSILGRDTPQHLLDTLIYLIGLNFAFRAGLEHRNLRFENSQIELLEAEDGECLRYTEEVSKTNQGVLTSWKVKPKVVFAFPKC